MLKVLVLRVVARKGKEAEALGFRVCLWLGLTAIKLIKFKC